MQKFFLKSMGCKTNQAEGQIIEQNLIKFGFKKVSNQKDADFYILNSCSVTQKSDNEAMYLLRKAHSDGLKTVITGCIAQIGKDNLVQNEFIDYVFGNDEKFNIPRLLNSEVRAIVSDLSSKTEFNKSVLETSSRTRINLKIQDGCDNRCAYCIIPFARGKSRCADSDFVIEMINDYSAKGFKEVILTGIHVGLWKDELKKYNLFDLIKKIETETTVERYRIGSLNPLEINSEMLDYLKTSTKFCPHFHLSLQSLCNNTLKSMNRFYTAERCIALIDEIYEKLPLAFIGSDIIAGFAGETEADFETTVNNLISSKLSKIHTFPYSIRTGTEAEKMQGHLDEKLKETRTNIIKKISEDKYRMFITKNMNTVQDVLIEKHLDKHTGYLKGMSKNYLSLVIKGNSDITLCNTIQRARITGTEGLIITAELINK